MRRVDAACSTLVPLQRFSKGNCSRGVVPNGMAGHIKQSQPQLQDYFLSRGRALMRGRLLQNVRGYVVANLDN